MDIDTETETCSSVIINKNIKNKKSGVEAEKKKNSDKDTTTKMLKNDDNSDIKVDIDKDEIKKIPANINFYFEAFCNSDDLSWSVDDSPYLTEGDLDILLSSKVIKDDPKSITNILKQKEKIITTSKFNQTKENNVSDEKNLEEFGTQENLNLTSAKKLKRSQDEDVHNSVISNIDEISLLDVKLRSRFGEDKNNDEDSNETNFVSINSHKLQNFSESSTDIPGPSCSKNLTSLLGSSSCSKSLDLPNSFNANLSGTFFNDHNEVPKYLSDYFKECFLKGTLVPMTVPEDVEVGPLEECDYAQFIENSAGLETDNENLDLEEESNDFVEDPDIVNPEIVYNIELNEHYKHMDILVQQISENPDDLTVLDECMKLPPIPQVEHEPKTFTPEERLMFMNGCSKWDYKIDRDDWTKIMVKRAVIFTAHAGFTIANEESLYVLADVIIDYIKKLAVIMKKNFDIQSNSSYSTSIDPINLSLQEIGVEGGIKEVMQHYKNDIFDRREKLMNKCQHLQKVIDQYVERMQHDNRISNQYVANEDFLDETSTNEIVQTDDNIPLPGIINETESIVEVNAEFQSLLEGIQNESQPIAKENITNTELKLTEPIYMENTSEFEPKIDTNSRSIESTKTDEMEIKDRKIYNTTTVSTKKKDTDLHYELMKPFTLSEEDQIKETKEYKLNLLDPKPIDREEFFREYNKYSNHTKEESYEERKKAGKLLSLDEMRRTMPYLFEPYVTQHNSDPDYDYDSDGKTLTVEEINESYKRLYESIKSSNDAGSSQTDKNVAQDNSTPIQTVIVSNNSDKNDISDFMLNKTIQNVCVTVNNLNVSDNDLVSMQPKSSSD